jgi:hypothetical protein
LSVGYDAARIEEPMLTASFGADYQQYQRCTPNRILPLDRLLKRNVRGRGRSSVGS